MEYHADFLIVGSGIAALRAAAELAGAGQVLILTKAEPLEGNTGYAQGGIAAAVGAGDTPELHARDTIAAGDGLCDVRAVQVLVGDGPRYVRELMEWGARFDRGPDGTLELAIEGAHSVRRVLHAHDATGREIARTLWARVGALPGITVHQHARVVELLVDGGRCGGARFLTGDGSETVARAAMVLLATGGAGQVYSETTNPPVATGDGIVMAYRAGAAVADMEFVQFHPTALKVPGQPRFLLSEALRGEGARLLNGDGEPFMLRYDPKGDLAPRDRVSRSIAREEERTGKPVYLSLETLDARFVHERFPLIASACLAAGLDLAVDRIPVGPAAHYVMGGVVTDVDGRTTIPGLFAAGEVACTGVHGANRLASNSLLEGLVFGARAGSAMRERPGRPAELDRTLRDAESGRTLQNRGVEPGGTLQNPEPGGTLQNRGVEPGRTQQNPAEPCGTQVLMWRDVGLFRERGGLERALASLEPAWEAFEARVRNGARLDAAGWRTFSLTGAGRLIARAALRREESRGAHYRSDFPARDEIHWAHRIVERLV